MSDRRAILVLSPTLLSEPTRADPEWRDFDLGLLRDLAALGRPLAVPVEGDWRGAIEAPLKAAGVEVVRTPAWGRTLTTLPASAWLLRGRTFETAVLTDAGPGASAGLELLRRLGVFDRLTLLARRRPSDGLARVLRHGSVRMLACSRFVRDQFPADLRESVTIRGGVRDAALFAPRAAEAFDPNAPVRFGLLVERDADVPGARQAMEAFSLLPAAVRARCQLEVFGGAEREGLVRASWQPGVRAVPALSVREQAAVLPGLDVLLVPADSARPFAFAAARGMLAGVPVIGSWAPTVVEMLDTGAGMACRTAEAYAAAIQALTQDRGMRARMAAEARRVALGRYVWESGVVL